VTWAELIVVPKSGNAGQKAEEGVQAYGGSCIRPLPILVISTIKSELCDFRVTK